MTKYTVFFDESGDQHIKVFAGFVAANDQWERFEKEWHDVLRRFEAPPLHMRTFAHSINEFATWKGDEQRRIRFLEALMVVIRIRTRAFFATAVLINGFEDVASQYASLVPELGETGDVSSVPTMEYPMGSLTMVIAPLAAEELVIMEGISNQPLRRKSLGPLLASDCLLHFI
jgi:hypothetical protein